MLKKIISKKKKILFFVSEDWYFISHRLKLALFLLEKNYEVQLCCKNTGSIDYIKQSGIKWHQIDVNRKSLSILHFFKEAIIFSRVSRNFDPDIIHMISMRQIVVGLFAVIFNKKKKICLTFTGMGFLFTEKTIKSYSIRIIIKYLLFFTSKFLNVKAIVQNIDDREFLEKKFYLKKNKITVIKGSGIDLKHFKVKPEPVNKNITLTYVGRLLKDKGIDQMIEAFILAKKEFKNLSLIIAGPLDQNNPSSLSEEEVSEIIKIKDIHYLGNVKDVRMLWNKSNIAILLSKREGLPLSLMEAAAVGRSIISTDVPGCREIAKNGVNSITVPFGNIQKTKDAILKLAKNKTLRSKYSKNGRKLLEQEMRQEIIFSEYLEVYESKEKINKE